MTPEKQPRTVQFRKRFRAGRVKDLWEAWCPKLQHWIRLDLSPYQGKILEAFLDRRVYYSAYLTHFQLARCLGKKPTNRKDTYYGVVRLTNKLKYTYHLNISVEKDHGRGWRIRFPLV